MLDRLWNRIKHGKIHTAESPDDICVICYENWTNAGTHGLCSLPCGHLFGQSCINKWLQDHDRCPECNAISAQTDIRLIRARNLKVIDNTNEEIFKREIKELKTANHKLTEENARLASQNQLLFVGGNFKSHFLFQSNFSHLPPIVRWLSVVLRYLNANDSWPRSRDESTIGHNFRADQSNWSISRYNLHLRFLLIF